MTKHPFAPDSRPRCEWSYGGMSEAYIRYHDEEWGVPVHDDRRQFEFLILEGAQAGLELVHDPEQARGLSRGVRGLRRREGRALRQAQGRAADAVSRASCATGSRSNPRSATRRPCSKLQDEVGGLRQHLWSFVGGKPIVNKWTRDEAGAGDQRGVRRAQQGPEEARVQVRGLDDHLRAHAGDGDGQRPHGRVLPARRLREAGVRPTLTQRSGLTTRTPAISCPSFRSSL